MRHLVVGAGEVGTAISHVLAKTFDDVMVRDVELVAASGTDVLHVCFPWSPSFERDVAGYVTFHSADLVVVHSTVPVGVCDPQGWVHSPVRGRHPHLVEGLETFVKHFGGVRAIEAAAVFDAAGVAVRTHRSAADTEAGKLWELVQFGVQVQVEKQIHAWCESNGVDFDVAYTEFAMSYNAGWAALGHVELMRPVLAHMPGPIGGHCVVPCSEMLDHPLAGLVRQPVPDTVTA